MTLKKHVFAPNFKNTFMKQDITIIIPFLNEGEEVEKTLASIRDFSENVPIILINDASEDGFDYDSVADKFGVRYVKNKERLGVARSRDLGVELATTNYFLLLDAHMRFYEPGWEMKICSFLKDNPKTVVCCQNIPLHKTDGGYEVSAERAYGAKLSLFNRSTNGVLQLSWISEEAEKGSPFEEIPCVLGAAYATSKKFWGKIKGLEGLRQYGSDEVYLSLKTWLAGGRCILFKDIAIGHVYRNDFPYKIQSFYMVFNIIFIVKVLFPVKYDIYLMYLMKRILDIDILKSAYRTYLENQGHIEGLKKYYKRWKSDFSAVEKLNDLNLHGYGRHDPRKLQRTFDQIVLNLDTESNLGLNGKMGMLVFLFIYDRVNKTPRFRFFLKKQLNSLIERVDSTLSDHFCNGLFGIGWAIEYLMQHGLVDRANRDEVLGDMDSNVLKFNFSRFSDHSLRTGWMGVFHFMLARVMDRDDEHQVFTRAFVNQCLEELKTPSDMERSSLELMEKLKYYADGGNLKVKTSIGDILDFNAPRIDARSNGLFGGLSFVGIKSLVHETDLFV